MNTLFTAIDHPAIACRDVDRQIEWYCRHLGMTVISSDGKSPPSVLVGYIGQASAIELMPARDAGDDPATFKRFAPGLRHLALRVNDFDRAYQDLKAAGVVFLFEPVNAVGGGKIVSFRDPEGNELQIVQR